MSNREGAAERIDFAAWQFVAARAAAEGFNAFPGDVPTDLSTAYAIQQAATRLWPDTVGGWKVGRIPAALEADLGAERFAGPIFARTIVEGDAASPADFPVHRGGFGAVEAEIVLRLGHTPPPQKQWTAGEAAALIGSVHIAIEVAGSPLATIMQLGPTASIAAFGNNSGLILGPAISDWAGLGPITCATMIDDDQVGNIIVDDLTGPMAALAFALEQAHRLGSPLREGDLVSTGALTGVHPIDIGQHALADFGALGSISCRAVPARPLAA
ncbi:2-keto-4-pentenoate hydratase [Sphingomonas oleivorans]|uniref:2-keto-4-pentenoate hydratase n=1 Tax=Sphingomonas oleivorans TaxID=1735121 RepID=A0A2T5G280_9SPHN|nr:fumarylacetoacetate hydrolase family protein [Sphingomonas oleivorans]PTQ13246.1 2-keto-4-pentenoate hydratase [Sphingomonas oleivorans]